MELQNKMDITNYFWRLIKVIAYRYLSLYSEAYHSDNFNWYCSHNKYFNVIIVLTSLHVNFMFFVNLIHSSCTFIYLRISAESTCMNSIVFCCCFCLFISKMHINWILLWGFIIGISYYWKWLQKVYYSFKFVFCKLFFCFKDTLDIGM